MLASPLLNAHRRVANPLQTHLQFQDEASVAMTGVVLSKPAVVQVAKSKQTLQQPTEETPPSTPPGTPLDTPTVPSSSVHTLFEEIRSIYTILSGLSDLAPSPQINTLLTRLVELCIQPYSPEFVDYFFSLAEVDLSCHGLRLLCGSAEGELEKHWARTILDSSTQTNCTYSLHPSKNNVFNYIQLNPYQLLHHPNRKPKFFSPHFHTIKITSTYHD
jgi:hypothetical protein